MPTTQADTQAARNAGIVALAANQLAGLWPQVDWESPDAAPAIKTVYGGIVKQFGQAAAVVAAQSYDEHRATHDLNTHYTAVPADPFPQAAIDKAVDSAFLGGNPSTSIGSAQSAASKTAGQTTSDLPVDQRVEQRLTTSLQRRVMQPARDTVAINAAADPAKNVRYIRVPRGKSTCAFCIMLASRDLANIGGKTVNMKYLAANVKLDKDTGRLHVFSENGAKFHDHCDCEAVALFDGMSPVDASPDFYHYQDLYNKAAAEAGTHSDVNKILASMRRLTNDGAIEENRPDVRDRAGENNRRAPVIDVQAADPDDDEEQPNALDVDHGTTADAHPAAALPDVADALDDLDEADDDYADLGDPADAGEPGPAAPETKLDKALRELSEAMENGADDDEIDRLADLSDKLQDQADKAAAKRAAAKDDIQRRILELIEGGEDPQAAEAEVVSQSPANVKRAQATSARAVYAIVLEKIRRRDFMAQARADGHYGNSFDSLVEQTFWTMADEAFYKAEAATNGRMLKRKYDDGDFDSRKLWYVNQATARKYMSDELAEWFDQNGRLTLPILRGMILEGESTYSRHREDFLQ